MYNIFIKEFLSFILYTVITYFLFHRNNVKPKITKFIDYAEQFFIVKVGPDPTVTQNDVKRRPQHLKHDHEVKIKRINMIYKDNNIKCLELTETTAKFDFGKLYRHPFDMALFETTIMCEVSDYLNETTELNFPADFCIPQVPPSK